MSEHEPKTLQEAQREAEVRQALTLTEGQKQVIKAQVDWHVEGIENVVQRALYEKVAPLLCRMWKDMDRMERQIERMKKKG